jgi:hypothetical protein
MNRINIINFGKLPILANELWSIPKYTCYKNENFYKKNLLLQDKNFSLKCIFLKKNYITDQFENYKNIFSNLQINSNNYLIEEICNYSYNKKNNYIDIEYLIKNWQLENTKLILKDRFELSLNLENTKKINLDFNDSLLPNTQELLINIKNIIQENRNNIKVII